MASSKSNTFQDYLNYLGGLLNISYANMSASQQVGVQSYYKYAAETIWGRTNWLEICPYGEARFAGNLGRYPNDQTKPVWIKTGLTATGNAQTNPADGRLTATLLMETAANSPHDVQEAYTFLPATAYQVTFYFRPILGRSLIIAANDGVNSYSAFFSPLGQVGANSGNLSQASTCVQANNGFWICTIYFTSANTAGAGFFGAGSSPDGATTTFAGNVAAGFYAWGAILNQTTYASPTAQVIPWEQEGEAEIEQVFTVWNQSPAGASYPITTPYNETPAGIQILGTNGWSWNGWLYTAPNWYNGAYPVYLYYRQRIPDYSGTAYDPLLPYLTGQQILFADSFGRMDFWKATVDTVAGESPDTAPAKWLELKLPNGFFKYVTYAAYADYLRMDAQSEKAEKADSMAEAEFLDQTDKLERQSGWLPPMKVSTHVTSQPRGLGW